MMPEMILIDDIVQKMMLSLYVQPSAQGVYLGGRIIVPFFVPKYCVPFTSSGDSSCWCGHKL